MLKIVVSSLSDCREKNGVVTFMDILRRSTQRFVDQGIEVAFANYVDFPAQRGTTPAAATAVAAPTRAHRWALAAKHGVKGQLAKRPMLAFMMMMSTLGRRALIAVWKARRLEEPESVHFYQDWLCALFGQALLRRDSRKMLLLHSGNDSLGQLFVHFHGMRGTRYEAGIRKQFHRILSKLDGIVTLNERYAQTLREQFPEVNVRCIYNTSPFASELAVSRDDAQSTLPRDGARIEIIAVGSLQHIKGFDLLIEATAGLSAADRGGLHITIVGGGADRASLQATIDAHDLEDVVTLNGESNDVASFLARADAYILPSRDEGFPIALIEASNFGLPIVTTRVGSIPEVFDEGSCVFMEAKTDSIRDALLDISRGSVDLRELSRRSKSVFDSKLSLEAFLSAYCRLFTEVGRGHAT